MGRFISPDPEGEGPNGYEYCRSNPLSHVDPNGRWTVAVLAGDISLAALLRIGGSAAFAFDDDGNVGVMRTAAIGGGTPSLGVSSFLQVTNADTIRDLQGWGFECGLSASPGWTLGVMGVFGSPNTDQEPYRGFEVHLGPSVNIPFLLEGHATATYTEVWDLTKTLGTLADELYAILRRVFEMVWAELPQQVRDMIEGDLGSIDSQSLTGGEIEPTPAATGTLRQRYLAY